MKSYQQASQLTAENLRSVAKSVSVSQLSRLSLPEVEAVVELVSKVVPAGNVPGMILSGLARLPGRRVPAQKMQQDINALFSGVEQILDKAVYHAFFTGPAAIIWGYQNLLKLAGKEPEAAFPEGVWQFYASYALREDTARFANETHGFDTALAQNNIRLNAADRLTAWIMAAVTCLHQYDALLENEWRERTATALLEAAGKTYPGVYPAWEAQRPFRREQEAAGLNYPAYRRMKFDSFLKESLSSLPASSFETWDASLQAAAHTALPAYQKQMSILAYLEPNAYGETRIPFHISEAQVGIIYRDGYYLLPACEPASERPLSVTTARAQAALILGSPLAGPSQLVSLARVRRAELPKLLSRLNPMLVGGLDNLRYAPILISADERSRALPLSEVRLAERGIGSHALTIFDTGETFVFDQSHIFFDGAWGSALAEIMTNEALSWAHYLSLLNDSEPAGARIYTSLTLQLSPADLVLTQQAGHAAHEIGAETDRIHLKNVISLRKQFKQRNEKIQLTINDLLVMYRAIHAATYRPSAKLNDELARFAKVRPDAAGAIRQMVEEASRTTPSILIPVDASRKNPRERVFPLNIEVPLQDLNLLGLHAQTVKLLNAYEDSTEDRAALYSAFERSQKIYLATLAGFGAYLAKLKEIAAQGESSSAGAIKLLAFMPPSVQKMLDQIPENIGMLNNLLKGREVFSNVGAVSAASTLTRFITAKDDNNQKQLAWGVITDAHGVMRLSLRDFRPHVAMLLSMGRKDLAGQITRDYLEAYADGFNAFIEELSRITRASRETKPTAITRKRNTPRA